MIKKIKDWFTERKTNKLLKKMAKRYGQYQPKSKKDRMSAINCVEDSIVVKAMSKNPENTFVKYQQGSTTSIVRWVHSFLIKEQNE